MDISLENLYVVIGASRVKPPLQNVNVNVSVAQGKINQS